MVRPIELLDSTLAFVAIDVRVPGDSDAMAFRHDQIVIAELAVAVDEETRKSGEHGGSVAPYRQRFSEFGGSNVPADVRPQLLCIQTELVVLDRNGTRGMLARQQQRPAGGTIEYPDGIHRDRCC